MFHIGEWNILQDPFLFDSETYGLLTPHLQYEKIIKTIKKRSLQEDMKRIQSFQWFISKVAKRSISGTALLFC
jgi:hypothetical protein